MTSGSRSFPRAPRPTRPSGLHTVATATSSRTAAGTLNPRASGALGDDNFSPSAASEPYPAGAVGWARRNKALAISLAAGLGGVVLLAIWSLATSGQKPPNQINETTPNQAVTPVVAKSTSSATTLEKNPAVAVVESLKPAIAEAPTPRESKAIGDLKAIKEAIAGGKVKPFELRMRLEAYLKATCTGEWRMKQPFGIEAAALLEKYKKERRPPDKADGAAPGLSADLIYEKAADNFATDFKPAEVKTVRLVEFKSPAALKEAFGHDMEIAMKLTGFIEIPKDGEYSFYVSSDDGSIFYVGDLKLIDNAGSHAMAEKSGHNGSQSLQAPDSTPTTTRATATPD